MIQVIVPFYNCAPWIARTLHTVAQQRDVRFDVVVMDDESTDGSDRLAIDLCNEYRFRYCRTPTNMKCPRTIYEAVKLVEPNPETIIYLLDGDDFLPHDRVLRKVQDVYDADPELWVAYGKYDSIPHDEGCQQASPYSAQEIANRSFRGSMVRFNHPLTFKTWLFNRIRPVEFQTPWGDWLRAGYDRALMYPLLEMATHYDGIIHWTCMKEILYSYNSINPISEFRAEKDPHPLDLVEGYRKKAPQWKCLANFDVEQPYEDPLVVVDND